MYKFFATLIQTRKIVITNHVPFSVICTDIQFLKSFARVCDTIIYYYYYILFCKGRTIPNKSLSLEIFIYLLCFRDVLYFEGRSCALPSSGSLLIYPVFPLCVNSICPFPRGRSTWVFFGWVCAARDSKLSPRSKKNFL